MWNATCTCCCHVLQGVAAVVVQPHALAVLTKQRAVWVLGGLGEGVEAPARPPVRVAEPPLSEAQAPALGRAQMALLETQFSLQRSPEVRVGVGGGDVRAACWRRPFAVQVRSKF